MPGTVRNKEKILTPDSKWRTRVHMVHSYRSALFRALSSPHIARVLQRHSRVLASCEPSLRRMRMHTTIHIHWSENEDHLPIHAIQKESRYPYPYHKIILFAYLSSHPHPHPPLSITLISSHVSPTRLAVNLPTTPRHTPHRAPITDPFRRHRAAITSRGGDGAAGAAVVVGDGAGRVVVVVFDVVGAFRGGDEAHFGGGWWGFFGGGGGGCGCGRVVWSRWWLCVRGPD
ncbi:hypothetical protein M409DRAFT_48817 [Zasmidium cellare ATCC 36951]|uniref:Uncharacterized protein n=1 Tax=Zasmidium cellare ATCC 36951 TaxID=1080233 RepID=A0A6A6D659_ZASCE|nr:uncharacterized protein M409DRAFT_48817 [Zasmidium cellare ATCC 36951]KAF2173908.1 hypothetical protein M409DRAFT_48817 [Zasmidium cellare ATCC 36951]